MSFTVVWEFGFGCPSCVGFDARSVVLALLIDGPDEAFEMGEC